MSRDKATYGKISDKYDEWVEMEKSRPPRATVPKVYTPEPESGSDMGKYIITAIGLGIAFLLLLLAGLSFWTAAEWGDYARGGAMVGYNLVGIFLLIAAFGGAWATVNHNFRVVDGS